MKTYINDSKINSILKLKSSDDFCFCYEPIPEYGDGEQKLYEIMEGLYFFVSDIKHKKFVYEKIENAFDSNVIAIYHCIEGESLLQLNNYMGKLSERETFYFVGNNKFVMSKPYSKKAYVIGFIAYTEVVNSLLHEFRHCYDIDINLFYKNLLKKKKPFIIQTKFALTLLIKNLTDYIKENNYFMIKNKAWELLYQSFLQYDNTINCKFAYKVEAIEKVNQIKIYLDNNYKESIVIEDVVKKFNINKTYFYQVFKYLHGISPYKYITKLRLIEAHKLILKSDLSIEKISYTCGYNNPNKFIKQFKKEYGKTPGKIR